MNTANSPSAPFNGLLSKMFHGSRYAKRLLDADPALSNWLQENYATPCAGEEIQAWLRDSNFDLNDEAQLSGALRNARKRVMLKLLIRDLNGLADLNEVMRAMTAFAEICLQRAQACLMQSLQAQFGQPTGESSDTPQKLLIIGMGKLGGGELNVSSDIDLIFIYPEDGETDGERKLGNHEFFTRLGRRLINLINEPTADGYVFRVDMRLRPYGDSGPLVMSFAALEEYLISQGREWERYAWIKARVVSPVDAAQISALSQLVQPFIYRKYLDFGAIDSMRQLHAQIRQEIQRRDRLGNIKLGPGGIREIEFIAQVFQLIRGGQNTKLRTRATQGVLRQLADDNHLPAPVVTGLNNAYIFLRNLEHRLQYLDDQQTQELPEKPGDQIIISATMGYADYPLFLDELNRHRSIVSEQFEKIFGVQPDTQNEFLCCGEDATTEMLTAHLSKLGYRVPAESALRLLQLYGSSRYRQLPEQSKQRIGKLVPQFIKLAAGHSDPDTAISRLLGLLEGISRRAAYLAFLSEHPQSLTLLAKLLAASSWATDYLTRHPALLDELLDAREMYQSPQWHKIDSDLQTRLDDCAGDVERQLDVLRHTQQEQTFHLLAMDIQGLLPLETLSDHLSALADLMLQHVLKLCWRSARKKHREDAKFAVIAYGKLGGKELGYASDLDLIFLYDDTHPDAQENYSRLAQHMNTVLSSHTSSGRLYETDLRLRPNGESGLLVSSMAAFAEYQQQHAWVWEHQALSRARFSAGDAGIGAQFETIRKNTLCLARDGAKLRNEILSMRQKVHEGHPNNTANFDIKHDAGGMVDIEFIVQYIVLAYAHRYPQLAENIGNIALLKLAGELEIISEGIAEQARNLYRRLRQTQHRMRLNNQAFCRVDPGEFDVSACENLWRMLLAAP
jgi:glutamate-ammonia-ligase adenylyltransferase